MAWKRLLSWSAALSLAACGAEDTASQTASNLGSTEGGVCTAATTCEAIEPSATDRACVFFVGFDSSGSYSPANGTNVGRLYQAVHGPAAKSGPLELNAEVVTSDTTRAYIEGVPAIPTTESAERVARGRSAICQHLATRKEPCDIVLVGFSRGAAVANQVARVMDEVGCEDGGHLGEPIALLGMFDPVSRAMGFEWTDEAGNDHPWEDAVPPNVERFVQVYKSPLEDPRSGLTNSLLSTTLFDVSKAGAACDFALTSDMHPEKRPWHHGDVGSRGLPRDMILCALDRAGIDLD